MAPKHKPTHLTLIMPSTLPIRLRVYAEEVKASQTNVFEYKRDVDGLRAWEW